MIAYQPTHRLAVQPVAIRVDTPPVFQAPSVTVAKQAITPMTSEDWVAFRTALEAMVRPTPEAEWGDHHCVEDECETCVWLEDRAFAQENADCLRDS